MAAQGEPAAATPTKANWEAPENITRLRIIVWPTVSPLPTDTAPKVAPNTPA